VARVRQILRGVRGPSRPFSRFDRPVRSPGSAARFDRRVRWPGSAAPFGPPGSPARFGRPRVACPPRRPGRPLWSPVSASGFRLPARTLSVARYPQRRCFSERKPRRRVSRACGPPLRPGPPDADPGPGAWRPRLPTALAGRRQPVRPEFPSCRGSGDTVRSRRRWHGRGDRRHAQRRNGWVDPAADPHRGVAEGGR
jgi:hypothetical protein